MQRKHLGFPWDRLRGTSDITSVSVYVEMCMQRRLAADGRLGCQHLRITLKTDSPMSGMMRM